MYALFNAWTKMAAHEPLPMPKPEFGNGPAAFGCMSISIEPHLLPAKRDQILGVMAFGAEKSCRVQEIPVRFQVWSRVDPSARFQA